MVEMAERGHLIPFWQRRILPEGHPYTCRDICAMSGLTIDNVKRVISKRDNQGQEPLVRPDQIKRNHIPTNVYSPQDLEIFMRIQKLKEDGSKLGEAIDTVRKQLLIEKAPNAE